MKKNKDNHSKHFHKQRKKFSQFSLSVDGMLGKEALVVLTSVRQLMEKKIEEPIMHVRGWVTVGPQ